ncbi:MAG: DMT family transporter [Actinobacteria bacterium]|nr:DMT family transporter [Actinomycetota bacterium]
MIFGLGAAFGWGLGDLWAAISGRRIGAYATVVIAQAMSVVITTALILAVRTDLAPLASVAGWLVPNAFAMAAGYYALYRGLELGPVAVVSPVLATYAVVPVLLAVGLLGETLSPLVFAGIALTIVGAALSSTDLRAFRSGLAKMPPGLPWALASSLLFGLSAYVFGWATRSAGWLPALWLSRTTGTSVLLLAGLVARSRGASRERPAAPPSALARFWPAVIVGLVDLFGVVMYARGSEIGYISIVSAASATYPILPVIGGVLFLKERPAPNQYLGVALVVAGLLSVGRG